MGNTSRKISAVKTKTVQTLDLDAYAGLWYQIASIPKSYDSGCDHVFAVYQVRKDGTIDVNNYCWSNGLPNKDIHGVAWTPAPDDPGKLLVKFDGVFSSEPGNYWLYETDYTSYALVGGGDPDSMWILSRKQKMSLSVINQLLTKMEANGYNVGLARISAKAVSS